MPPDTSSELTDDDFYLFTCPKGFDVYDHDVGQYREKAFYDQDGNLIRGSGHRSGYDNLHRQGDFAKMLSHQYSMSWHWDYTTQLAKVTGSGMNIHLPDGNFTYRVELHGFAARYTSVVEGSNRLRASHVLDDRDLRRHGHAQGDVQTGPAGIVVAKDDV